MLNITVICLLLTNHDHVIVHSLYSVKMSVELDVFVGNTTIMDKEVYQLWLNGYTGRVLFMRPQVL